ncbi:AAA family ATPase [Flammeovirga kamogawensis]|uniref:MoxR family ATPase n=1 Tax=Flammeovirga kamogawensis TaxID=373891 RepID=A0ABX8H317_9BACT|nr:MoxR family ATPase [Flammeovirga kamogawensis]MBB6460497.1 MoxR-like ATPase [Flammeovirga kamogawensis]QWG10303.1 MoxR family ATPase [Flammeovirga kamogawensis]TRX64751.1 MoxR family ATPase [Flammeovirga kamogawensis]
MEENAINNFENRIDTSSLIQDLNKLREGISKVVKGQQKTIDLLLTAILADGHVLLEGVPGVAKTLTAKTLSIMIEGEYSRIQFTPDLMPSDVIGTNVYNAASNTFDFRKGPIFGNIVLVDEINRAPAKTQSSLFEVMEERQITYDGTRYKMEEPFLVIGTQNPVEQEGTYPLPEAQLDRFLFKIDLDYPEEQDELEVLKMHHEHQQPTQLIIEEFKLNRERLKEFRDLAKQVIVKEEILDYILKLVRITRTNKDLYLGASPRAGVALLNASKAWACLQGRDFVTPDDIAYVIKPILRHRLIMTAEKEMEGENMDRVIDRIIHTVEVPR